MWRKVPVFWQNCLNIEKHASRTIACMWRSVTVIWQNCLSVDIAVPVIWQNCLIVEHASDLAELASTS